MSFDKYTNLDSREGFELWHEEAQERQFTEVGFDSLSEFDNPAIREEYNAWIDSHNEPDEDLFPNDDDFEYPEEENDGQPDEYTEWQDFNGGDDWDQGQFDCENDY